MTTEAIGAIASSVEAGIVRSLNAGAATQAGMSDAFARHVEAVDKSLQVAENDMRALAIGKAQNLHEVMIHMEEARLSFQLLAQVRNHVLEAYQEVMRTQV
jgi:flagellar hook-basal body complex protein FliE